MRIHSRYRFFCRTLFGRFGVLSGAISSLARSGISLLNAPHDRAIPGTRRRPQAKLFARLAIAALVHECGPFRSHPSILLIEGLLCYSDHLRNRYGEYTALLLLPLPVASLELRRRSYCSRYEVTH